MTEALFPAFPSVSFISQVEFANHCRDAQPRLDTRHLYETSLATHEDILQQPGTCAPCLRRARFTSHTTGWERLADGRRVPSWGGALACDCEHALPSSARALLHFAESVAALRHWTRLLLFGPRAPADGRLAMLAGATTMIRRFTPGEAATALRLDAVDGAFHLAIATDCLHRVPLLRAGFAEFRRVLVPGGSLVFTVPFRYRAGRTLSRGDLPRVDGRLPAEFRDPVHEIGWDVLDWLRAAGFGHAAAHSYWSNELGYLGPFNMILHATV